MGHAAGSRVMYLCDIQPGSRVMYLWDIQPGSRVMYLCDIQQGVGSCTYVTYSRE